jgi:2-keto-4-pentenoate hydratase/2-oxohepta-3-ene-1,7-dioic acid hydratase in catechol pathway
VCPGEAGDRVDMTQRGEAHWLGRVVAPGGKRPTCVRIQTDGTAPGPNDLVEEIPDVFELARAEEGDPWALARQIPAVSGGLRVELGAVSLAPPVHPGKIVAVGRNFGAHAKEMGSEVPAEPLLFFKPSSCLVASGAPVPLPRGYERIDMEGEIVVVIGRRGRRISASAALGHVAGYTLGNDVSCRDLQRRDKQWTRAKGFDGFGPIGPFVRLVEPGTGLDNDRIRLRSFLNDELQQDAALSDMIFDVPAIIAFVSACMTLDPGDLVFMGTPSGVAQLSGGQVMRVELAGWDLGRLTNTVIWDSDQFDDDRH